MATKLVQQGGPPGSPPPVGTVVVYPKSDELLYFQGSDGVEHPLAGQVQPFAQIDGTAGNAFTFQNAGFASVIRTPAGDPAGDYTMTLTAPVTGTIVAPPGASSGRFPVVLAVTGASNPVTGSAEIVGAAFPYTQIRVRTRDKTFTAVDCFALVSLVPF